MTDEQEKQAWIDYYTGGHEPTAREMELQAAWEEEMRQDAFGSLSPYE